MHTTEQQRKCLIQSTLAAIRSALVTLPPIIFDADGERIIQSCRYYNYGVPPKNSLDFVYRLSAYGSACWPALPLGIDYG